MARRADGAAREFRRHEIREPDAVAAEPDGGIELVRPALEPGQALEAVVGPAGLAELAVVDHVDAGLRLARHHLRDRAPELVPTDVAMRGIAIASGVEHHLGADQAAHMGGEDAMLAPLHVLISR